MNFREQTLAIMSHQPTEGVLFQPRLEHWHNTNQRMDTLPERFKGMSLAEVYADLGCSIRPYTIFVPCLKFNEGPEVTSETNVEGNVHTHSLTTPVGRIETRVRLTESAWHTFKFPVETADDVRVLEYILRERRYYFDPDLYEQGLKEVGDLGAPMMFFPRINIQRLFIEFIGVENTLYALADDQEMVDGLIRTIDDCDEHILQVIADCPIRIVNFGDNIDQHYLPPYLLERYVIPQYNRRLEALHRASKLVHAHWDGSVKALIRFLKDIDLDGIEALTPLPQGDLTIPDMKAAVGDKVLLDGIPMTWFLPHESLEDLERVTREIIETFSPNLILGISDELSPNCDIEKVRFVAQLAESYGKPA